MGLGWIGVNGVGRKSIAGLRNAVCPPWIYIWLCDPGSVGGDDKTTVSLAVNSVTAAVGSIIPKANWYSGFFRAQGASALATEITDVYGFCTIVLVLYVAGYFSKQFLTSSRPRQLTYEEQQVLLVPAARDRLRSIENIVLGCGALTLYYDFIGYGLSRPGVVRGESTNGELVLGGPIFFFGVLAVVVVYCHQSRLFLKKSMTDI